MDGGSCSGPRPPSLIEKVAGGTLITFVSVTEARTVTIRGGDCGGGGKLGGGGNTDQGLLNVGVVSFACKSANLTKKEEAQI